MHQLCSSGFSKKPLAVFLSLTFAAGAASAQQNDRQLADVVVSAAGFEQKITDAPASISVVTKEELAKRPYTSLIDAVRDLEGVDVGETADKTGQKTISMRGMGADYTLVLIDGKRQNNHGDIYPNSFQGNQFNHIPPLDAVERVEIIRGPAATLYGADALGGVINIITKKSAKEWTGSVTVGRSFQQNKDFGDDQTVDFSLRGPIVPGKLTAALRGSFYDREASNPEQKSTMHPTGVLHTPTLGFGGGGKTVDNENTSYGFTLHFTPTDKQTISFDYDNSVQKYDNSPYTDQAGATQYPLGTVDSIATIWRAENWCSNGGGTSAASCAAAGGVWNPGGNQRVAPRVGYKDEQKFTREGWSLSHEGKWDFGTSFVALSYIETDNMGRTMPFTVAERNALQALWNAVPGANANAKLAAMTPAQRAELEAFLPRQSRILQSNQYTLDGKLDIPVLNLAGDHLFVVGGQVIRGELKDGVFGMEQGTPGKVQKHRMWSVFAEDNWMITDSFTLTGGARYDDHDIFGDNISPRLYGVYRVNPQWTAKGGVTGGFKTPKTTQLYDGITGFGGQGTSPMFGNPDLKPETSMNTEVAVYWNHPNRHSFNATWFRNDFKDKISSQPCGAATGVTCASTGDYQALGYATSSKSVNIDEAEINGVELAGRWQIVDRWALRGNYTYTDSEQKSGASKGQPLTNSAKHMLNTTLDWQTTPDFNVFLTMEARAKRYRDQDPVTKSARYYKDYEIFHLGASYRISKHLTINGRINNLLDKDFTTYDFGNCVSGTGCVGGWTQLDDYNNKEKGRNFWVSVNASF